MSEVKRYDCYGVGERAAGVYVLANNYDQLSAANQRLEGEVARLREALDTAKYRIEQSRVWNGMGWTLPGLHPHRQQQVLDVINDALSTNGEVM